MRDSALALLEQPLPLCAAITSSGCPEAAPAAAQRLFRKLWLLPSLEWSRLFSTAPAAFPLLPGSSTLLSARSPQCIQVGCAVAAHHLHLEHPDGKTLCPRGPLLLTRTQRAPRTQPVGSFRCVSYREAPRGQSLPEGTGSNATCRD